MRRAHAVPIPSNDEYAGQHEHGIDDDNRVDESLNNVPT
jgi:hypothetical protein